MRSQKDPAGAGASPNLSIYLPSWALTWFTFGISFSQTLNRCEELEPLTLVLTTCTVYLIREDHVSWPLRCCSEDVPKGDPLYTVRTCGPLQPEIASFSRIYTTNMPKFTGFARRNLANIQIQIAHYRLAVYSGGYDTHWGHSVCTVQLHYQHRHCTSTW